MRHLKRGLPTKESSGLLHCTKEASVFFCSAMFLLVIFKTPAAFGSEWDCASTSGTYERSTDCTMLNQVTLSGDLTVVGQENVYSKLVAASNKRHFLINSGTPTLTLEWLNLTNGYANSDNGGSIFTNIANAHLKILHCVFFNNVADSSGGAIYSQNGLVSVGDTIFERNVADGRGGALYVKEGKSMIVRTMFTLNTAWAAGGICLWQSNGYIHNSSFYQNVATNQGGAVEAYANSVRTEVNLTRVDLIENRQTSNCAGGGATCGGAGIYIREKVNFNIRECRFVQNEASVCESGPSTPKQGHQIYTYTESLNPPFITLVNTNFTNVAENYAFFGYDQTYSKARWYYYVTPNNCNSNPCVVSPFTGTCSNRTTTNYGVICDADTCSSGSFQESSMSESDLPPSVDSCTPWADCTAGSYISVNGTSSSNRECTQCANGRFSTTTNEEACMPWVNCSAGSYVSTSGTLTSNRVCTQCTTGKYSTGTNKDTCTPWVDCSAGSYISVNGTSSSNRECTQCTNGRFSTTTNEEACMPWVNCSAGSYVSTSGTLTSNRVCTQCTNGKFSTAANEGTCMHWANCSAGSYISVNGTVTSNRECKSCDYGKFSTIANARSCSNWTSCDAGESASVNGSNSSDRICGSDQSETTTTTTIALSQSTTNTSNSNELSISSLNLPDHLILVPLQLGFYWFCNI